MAFRSMKSTVARATVATVVAFGVSVGGAVTFAPPAHAMLPADGGSSKERSFENGLDAYYDFQISYQRLVQLYNAMSNMLRLKHEMDMQLVRTYGR